VKRLLTNILSVLFSLTAFANIPRSFNPVPGYQPPSLSSTISVIGSLGWRGKHIDPTGNYYFGARSEYDPVAGRFTSADPLGHGASADLYSFCGGDPVNFFDPDGRFGKQTTADSGMSAPGSSYQPPDDQTLGAERSALINAIPLVGAIKQWYEMDTGKDAFTGEWLQGNDYLTALSVVVNVLPVAFGPAGLLEGGGENALYESVDQGLSEEGGTEAADAILAEPGDQSLAAIGQVEEGQAAQNIIRVDFTAGQEIAEEAELGAQANGTFGGGASAGYSGQATVAPGPSITQPTGGEGNSLTVVPSTSVEVPASQTGLIPYEQWPTKPIEKGGFLGGYSQTETAQPGQLVSRVGALNGRYVSPPGTSFGSRGLPSSYPNTAETIWEVVKPFDMQGGLAAPWKDAPGFGIQYKMQQSVQELWDAGFIKPVP
jgi:RHS repeat-associated protein